jgi:hypothetical protein
MTTQPSFLPITKTVAIPPLVELHNPVFQNWYRIGVLWCHNGREGEGPLEGRYLAERLLSHMKRGSFNGGQPDNVLYQWIAFYLGMIHGGVLLPDGTLRRDVTTLVTLDDVETRRGYGAGRAYFFLDADTDEERNLTDRALVNRIKRYAVEHMRHHDSLASWYFVIGNILGELSGHLFPWTQEEHRAYEEDSIREVGYVCKLPEGCLAARMYAPVATF